MPLRRFSLVDLIVAAIIVIAAIYVAESVRGSVPVAVKTEPVIVSFQSLPTPFYERDLELLRPGTAVSVAIGHGVTPLGTVATAKSAPYYEVVVVDGKVRKAANPLRRLVMLTIRAKAGRAGDQGYLFGQNPLNIGQTVALRAGFLRLRGVIVDIESP